MSEVTGGEMFARCLANEGIEFVFGLPSPEIDPLFASLEAHGIRLVPVRHEAAAVHMAEGLYKTTGKASVVTGNPGPGTANLLPGVITARHEGVPVLALTSQHRMGNSYPSPPSTFQGQDQVQIFEPAVKWAGPVFDWSRIAEVTRMAFRAMWNGRPGPVHLDVPAPVMYATGNEEDQRIVPPSGYRAPQPQASTAQIAAAADLLAAAERPVIVAGSGADRARANVEVAALAALLGCALIPTQAGRSAVPGDNPNYVFGFSDGGVKARTEADLILIAGSRAGNLDLPYDKYWGNPDNQKVIQIDIDPWNMGVTRPMELGIVADVKDAVGGIVTELESRGVSAKASATEALAAARATEEAWRMSLAAPIMEWAGPGIHPAHAMGAIGAAFGSDAVYTVDGGLTSQWAYSILPPTRPNSYHSILELGMLGTGIPSAIGAKLGEPDREVVCISGDGAAGFNIMEMQSAARDGIKVTTIIFAEGSWTMEETNELKLYGRTFGCEQGETAWHTVAEGLGCHSELVEKIEDLGPALERARQSDRPAVVAIKSDRDANRATPPELAVRWGEVQAGPQ